MRNSVSIQSGTSVNAAMPVKVAIGWNVHQSELSFEQSLKYAEEEKEETDYSGWRKPTYYLPSASYIT